MNKRQRRAVGAYLGLAVGDALGATVEFMTPGEIKTNYGVHDRIVGGGWLHLRKGSVTDDTEMALALGRALLESKELDAHVMAKAFDAWMRTKPVDIGNTVRRGLVRYRQSGDPLSPPSEHDAGNGAAMRLLPVVLATTGCDLQLVRAACDMQSHITHNNQLSDAACYCIAEMVHIALEGAQKISMLAVPVRNLLIAAKQFEFKKRREENPSGYIVHTMRAVLEAFAHTENFEAALVDVVNRGGDADTTGAILGAIAGAYYGIDAIPDRWLIALDEKIAWACRQQAVQLLDLELS